MLTDIFLPIKYSNGAMKHLLIFTDNIKNGSYISEKLKSFYPDTDLTEANLVFPEGAAGEAGYLQRYGGDNFSNLEYVALGDANNPIYVRENKGDTNSIMKFVVSEIKYDKKLFRPGEMTIKMSITPDKDANLTNKDYIQYIKKVFLNVADGKANPITVSVVGVAGFKEQTFEGTTIIDYQLVNIAVKYLVFSFNLSLVGTTRYVTLQCYSPDKKLELGKYSKVYSGMQFAEEIVKGEMTSRFMFDKSQIECSANRLRNLRMGNEEYAKIKILNDSSTAAVDNTRELVQPYLVQYNESFYDFIRRVAVRCGEFMCYRDGKFCIGLPSNIKPKKLTGKQIFIYPDVTIESNIALTVDSFASDYTESEKLINERNKGKSKEDLDKEQKEKEKKLYYVSDYVDDEQQHILCKKNDYVDSRACWFSAMVYDTVCKILPSAKDLTDIASTGAALAKDLISRGLFKQSSEKNFDTLETVYPEDMGIQRKGWDDLGKDKKMEGYTILDETKKKFLNQFYYNIEQGELAVERAKVDINFSSEVPDLDLTDAIDLDDGIANYYIVSRMYGSFINNNNGKGTLKNHAIEVVPTLDDKLKPNVASKDSVVALPPHCGIPHILKATAQEAVVVDTKDPLQIGRVRVRYLWQMNNKVLSPWIRVLVPFTCGGGGMLMTPAAQDHVMINYTGGNIERPYVSGFLYTAERFPNKGVAAADKRIDYKYTPRAITSGNGHSITFNDDTPKSFMNFLIPPLAASWNIVSTIDKGIKDLTLENLKEECDKAEVAYHEKANEQNLQSWKTAKEKYNNEKKNSKYIKKWEDVTACPLNGGIILKDVNGFYEINMSASKRNISIKSPVGDIKMNAFTGISISAPNGDINITGKNVNIKAGNNVSITSGTNIKKDNSKDCLGTWKTLGIKQFVTQSTSLLGEAVKAASPATKGVWDEMKNFTDLSFIRSCWEIIMRPVEGTLTLQSKRNVLVMAGVGKAWVPTSLLSKAGTSLESKKPSKWIPSLPTTKVTGEEASQNLDDQGFAIISLLRYTKQEVKAFYKNFKKDLEEIKAKHTEAKNQILIIPPLLKSTDILEKVYYNRNLNLLQAAWDKKEIKDYKEVLDDQELKNVNNVKIYKRAAKKFVENYKPMVELVQKFKSTYCDADDTLFKNLEKHWKREAYSGKDDYGKDKFIPPAAGLVSNKKIMGFEIKKYDDFKAQVDNPANFTGDNETKTMKVCIFNVLNGFKEAKFFVFDPNSKTGDALINGNDADWQAMVSGITKYEKSDDEKEADESKKKRKEWLAATLGPVLSDFGIEFKGDSWSIPSINGLINRKGAAGPRAFCEYEGAGSILMSSDKGFTQKIGGGGTGIETLRNPDLDAVKTYLKKVFDDAEPLVLT